MVLFDEKKPAVSFAKYAPNGKFVLVATQDDTLKIWSYINSPSLKSLKIYNGHSNRQYCSSSTFLVTDDDQRYIVSGSEDKFVYVWDLKSQVILQKLEGHTDVLISVSYLPMLNMIVSADLDNDKTENLGSRVCMNARMIYIFFR